MTSGALIFRVMKDQRGTMDEDFPSVLLFLLVTSLVSRGIDLFASTFCLEEV